MAWRNPKLTPEFRQWFMDEIEAVCNDKERANYAIHHGHFDVELEIDVAEDDKPAVRQALPRLIEQVKEKTEALAPVIYLSGEMDPELHHYKYSQL